MSWYYPYFCIDMSRCKSQKKLTQFENQQIGIATMMRLLDEAMDRYKFEGLPKTCSERVILQSLLVYGAVVFFEEKGTLLALPGAPSGKGYNMYGDPTSAWVFSRNGMFNKDVTLYVPGAEDDTLLDVGNAGAVDARPKKGVIVWENKTRSPFIMNTIYYAKAISDTLRTIDVNRVWLKRPFIPVCEETLVPSIKKMFGEMQDNEAFIPVSTGVYDINKFDLKPIDVSPQTIKTCVETVEWYENKYRELCATGANTQMDKKGENLIEAEVTANDEYIAKEDNRIIEYINEQLELVNKVFNTNIRCVTTKIEEKVEDKKMEGDGNNEDVSGDN